MKYEIDFLAGCRMFQGLLAGAPSVAMLSNEVKMAKIRIPNGWIGDKADIYTHTFAELKGKSKGDYITHGSIACASVSKDDPTSKNPEMHGSTLFFVWVYYPSKGETLEKTLAKQIKKINWDATAYDWYY